MRRALPKAFKTWRRVSKLERLAGEMDGPVLSQIYHHEKATLDSRSGTRNTTAGARSATVARGGDDSQLTRAYITLSGKYGLLLVDWRAQQLLLSVTEKGDISVWRP